MISGNSKFHPVFVSVIVCSLNGEQRIGSCLESLMGQTYGKENFEVIAIDDGSGDATSAIAHLYGVRVIRFETNRGIPIARNAGLSAAKGEIVAYIDDDCVADPNWLKNLVAVFSDQSVAAVGGKILALSRLTIGERYMEATGYGNPARPTKGKSAGLVARLVAYFHTMVRPSVLETVPIDVIAIYTANSAFRKKDLVGIGGFDEALAANEDVDVSARIQSSGRGKIIYAPESLVRHRHYRQLSKVLWEPYKRARHMLLFYSKENRLPPIFPMPVLYILVVAASTLLADSRPVIILSIVVALPILLYGWWMIRAVREKEIEFVLYPFIQLSAESAALLGVVKAIADVYVRKLLSAVSRSHSNVMP